MITYVNSVLVSNNAASTLLTAMPAENTAAAAIAKAGNFIMMNCDPDVAADNLYTVTATTDTFKIGVLTSNYIVKGGKYIPLVKWSNEIKAADIKNHTILTYTEDTQDQIAIDFSTADSTVISNGNSNIVLRISWKDLPTRYRQWTDSYNYVTKPGDDAAAVATALANSINAQEKRARAIASVDGSTLTLTAMEYDDDIADNTENPVGKVRMNAIVYYTDMLQNGLGYNNKYDLGATIAKMPGITYPASSKLVRQQEKNSIGYMGAIHRWKWYDKTPAIVADLNVHYNGITIEFENMYRAADDIFRKTKQTVELYADASGSALTSIKGIIDAILTKRSGANTAIDNSSAYDPDNYIGD